MMLIKLFIFFLITVDIARLVYIQSLYPSCITKMDSPGLLDTNIIPGHRDDGDFSLSTSQCPIPCTGSAIFC